MPCASTDSDMHRCRVQAVVGVSIVAASVTRTPRREIHAAEPTCQHAGGGRAPSALDEHLHWRRGGLRDVIGARELVHEWIDLITRMRLEQVDVGLPPFDPSDGEMRSFVGSMPHTQIAVSIKTGCHKNSKHKWTTNDISDIDAVSVAYAYCEAVFPDKAVRAALLNSKDLAPFRRSCPAGPKSSPSGSTDSRRSSRPTFWYRIRSRRDGQ